MTRNEIECAIRERYPESRKRIGIGCAYDDAILLLDYKELNTRMIKAGRFTPASYCARLRREAEIWRRINLEGKDSQTAKVFERIADEVENNSMNF